MRKKLKPLLKSEAGVTLVELLAAIAILGIIIALAGSIHIFGQRQFRNQTESANQTNDISYALSVMSTDLRRHSPGDVDVIDESVIEILNEAGDPVPRYRTEGNKLMQGDAVLINYVSSFTVQKIIDSEDAFKGIEIEVSIHSDKPGVEAKDYQTTIYFRGE
ncbi:MAG: prepilin-type N-terminal cleavage/methylation domain-containing protein [Clostridiaceae bacterium]|nr:prepilin-type N-terminal cleavage/methylation domain-containing protein [Clostridiaceae bacterium]